MFLLLSVLPALPFWMRSVFRRTSLKGYGIQIWVLVSFYICLGISVFLSFFLAWFTALVSYKYLLPYVFGLEPSIYFWDDVLTPRGVLFLFFLISVPWFVFFKVGLVCVRDVHQICKEQRDRVFLARR